MEKLDQFLPGVSTAHLQCEDSRYSQKFREPHFLEGYKTFSTFSAPKTIFIHFGSVQRTDCILDNSTFDSQKYIYMFYMIRTFPIGATVCSRLLQLSARTCCALTRIMRHLTRQHNIFTKCLAHTNRNVKHITVAPQHTMPNARRTLAHIIVNNSGCTILNK